MNAFLVFRYAVLALFIVFSTIIASISAWNLGLLRDAGFDLQIDAFLIFLGVTGLLVVFPILFIEFCRKGALVSRVWFEIAWVGLFWIMHLAGAAAFVAMAPSFVCGRQAKLAFENICVSQNVLKTFTWICSVMLVVYLLALIVSAALHMKEFPDIWKTGIPEVPWFAVNQRIGSSPPTPILVRYRSGGSDSTLSSEKAGVLPLYLPQPQRTRGQSPPRQHQPRTVQTAAAPPPRSEKLPVAPPVAHHPAHQPQARRQPTQYNPTSLYPSHVQHQQHVHDTLVSAGFFMPSRDGPRSRSNSDDSHSSNNSSSSSYRPAQQSPARGTEPRKQRPRPPPLDLTKAKRPLGTRVPSQK